MKNSFVVPINMQAFIPTAHNHLLWCMTLASPAKHSASAASAYRIQVPVSAFMCNQMPNYQQVVQQERACLPCCSSRCCQCLVLLSFLWCRSCCWCLRSTGMHTQSCRQYLFTRCVPLHTLTRITHHACIHHTHTRTHTHIQTHTYGHAHIYAFTHLSSRTGTYRCKPLNSLQTDTCVWFF